MTEHQEASPQPETDRTAVAREARGLVRRGLKAALATLDPGSGHPYASLVTVATDPAGRPTLLISGLARHTQNLMRDAKCSLLFDATDALADPLAGGRVTVLGRAEKTTDADVRRRFLARHPEAAGYADFKDFAFWRVAVEGAHFIGGFGRIFTLPHADMLIGIEGAEAVVAAEPGIVGHMNEDHADATELFATKLLGARAGRWMIAGCDPEGCDLMLDHATLRLDFPHRARTPGDIRKVLVELTNRAREG